MAIRFACPSCRQPIEIDDQWGGQSVACPYCKRVVSAPHSSTWPSGEVPMAAPAANPFSPPPPPHAHPPGDIPEAGAGASAAWALTLALSSAALSIFGGLIWLGRLAAGIQEIVGPDPTHEEISRAYQEMILEGGLPTSPIATLMVVVGAVCAILALILAIRALIRGEHRRTMAITACVVGILFLFCNGFLTLALITPRLSPPPG